MVVGCDTMLTRILMLLALQTVSKSLPLVTKDYSSPTVPLLTKDDSSFTVLPRCTKAALISGEIVRQNFDTTEISVSTNIHLSLGLHETACFHVQLELPSTNLTQNATKVDAEQIQNLLYNGSLLYAIEYKGLQQLHPIRQQYTFGVPQLSSKCVCDCPGGENHCVIGYNYKNCTHTNGICVTTYHPHQSSAGCSYGEESELCCDVNVVPYKNLKFAAVYLSQPNTVAEFRYRLFRSEKSNWIPVEDHVFKVPLNKNHRLELEDDKLEVLVNALKPHFQLKEAMFFYELDSKDASLKTGVPLNELYEWNIGKLGWFRFQDDAQQWTVRNGWIKLQDAHHAQVENCKGQTYTESYNADYYTSKSEEIVYLGRTVEEEEPWVERTFVDSRYVVVVHSESPSVSLDLTMNNRLNIKMIHHSSDLKDFSGQIQLDKFSNKYLNITYYESKGTLIGTVYKNEAKIDSDMVFSSYVNSLKLTNLSSIIMLPSTLNSSKWVCVHPVDRADHEICRWLSFHAQPLDWFEVPYVWTHNQGDCQGCNEMTFNSFLQYLNPAKWFNGITNSAEAVAVGVEIIFYLVVIVIVVAVCRRCICPLIHWSVCKGGPPLRKPTTKDSST